MPAISRKPGEIADGDVPVDGDFRQPGEGDFQAGFEENQHEARARRISCTAADT